MFHWQELTRAVIADREREIRNRRPRPTAPASGRRHPASPETSPVDDARAALEESRAPHATTKEPRPAFGS